MENYRLQKTRLLKQLSTETVQLLAEYDCYCCGGAIVSVFTNKEINDYDIYSVDPKNPELICEKLKEQGFELKVTTHNALSLVKKANKEEGTEKVKIQLIRYEKFCNKNIKKTFTYFDFNCCMGAYSFKKDKFYFDEYFLTDNIEKRLRFNPGTEYPICSLYRTQKYQKRGYFLPGIELIKIALAINDLKMKDFKDLKQQLMGIDTLFLKPLTDKLLSEEDNKYDFKKFKKELDSFYNDYYEKEIESAFGEEE